MIHQDLTNSLRLRCLTKYAYKRVGLKISALLLAPTRDVQQPGTKDDEFAFAFGIAVVIECASASVCVHLLLRMGVHTLDTPSGQGSMQLVERKMGRG